MNVLICGATTYGNKGDDVIKDIITDHLYVLDKNISIKVTRPYPQLDLIHWADYVLFAYRIQIK